jgi:hypothetical protein
VCIRGRHLDRGTAAIPCSQEWLDNGNGRHFGNGVMLGGEAWSPRDWTEGTGCNIEIWLQPDHVDRGGTVLGFSGRGHAALCRLDHALNQGD